MGAAAELVRARAACVVQILLARVSTYREAFAARQRDARARSLIAQRRIMSPRPPIRIRVGGGFVYQQDPRADDVGHRDEELQQAREAAQSGKRQILRLQQKVADARMQLETMAAEQKAQEVHRQSQAEAHATEVAMLKARLEAAASSEAHERTFRAVLGVDEQTQERLVAESLLHEERSARIIAEEQLRAASYLQERLDSANRRAEELAEELAASEQQRAKEVRAARAVQEELIRRCDEWRARSERAEAMQAAPPESARGGNSASNDADHADHAAAGQDSEDSQPRAGRLPASDEACESPSFGLRPAENDTTAEDMASLRSERDLLLAALRERRAACEEMQGSLSTALMVSSAVGRRAGSNDGGALGGGASSDPPLEATAPTKPRGTHHVPFAVNAVGQARTDACPDLRPPSWCAEGSPSLGGTAVYDTAYGGSCGASDNCGAPCAPPVQSTAFANAATAPPSVETAGETVMGVPHALQATKARDTQQNGVGSPHVCKSSHSSSGRQLAAAFVDSARDRLRSKSDDLTLASGAAAGCGADVAESLQCSAASQPLAWMDAERRWQASFALRPLDQSHSASSSPDPVRDAAIASRLSVDTGTGAGPGTGTGGGSSRGHARLFGGTHGATHGGELFDGAWVTGRSAVPAPPAGLRLRASSSSPSLSLGGALSFSPARTPRGPSFCSELGCDSLGWAGEAALPSPGAGHCASAALDALERASFDGRINGLELSAAEHMRRLSVGSSSRRRATVADAASPRTAERAGTPPKPPTRKCMISSHDSRLHWP